MAYGAPMQPYAPATTYGGFWIRFVAYFIDGIIVAIPTFVIAFVLGVVVGLSSAASGNQNSTAASNIAGGLGELVGLVITIGYFVYFWGVGSTLGMRLFKLRVADANTGQPIGFGRAGLRYIGLVISTIVCYIGLIWAAFDARKQGWHDKIAGTVVLQG